MFLEKHVRVFIYMEKEANKIPLRMKKIIPVRI